MVVLTCNRPQYVLLALRQIAAQDYHPLEALVVDDGTAQLSPLLRATYPALEIVPAAMQRPAVAGPAATGANATDAGDGLSVRLLSLLRHASIGEKRALASRAALGEVMAIMLVRRSSATVPWCSAASRSRRASWEAEAAGTTSRAG